MQGGRSFTLRIRVGFHARRSGRLLPGGRPLTLDQISMICVMHFCVTQKRVMNNPFEFSVTPFMWSDSYSPYPQRASISREV